jgi:RNA polymerase sigma factor (sigma-70 family)
VNQPTTCCVPGHPYFLAPDPTQKAATSVNSSGSQSGDRANRITTLFTSHYNQLLRLASFLGAEEEAEDVVAEAFCELYRRWGGLRDDGGAISYLQSTVRNLTRMHIRHEQVARRRAPTLAAAPEVPGSAEQTVIDSHGGQAVVRALSGLPHRQREALVLRYWMGFKDAEIADAMGISLGSVKVHIFRGMTGVRLAMTDAGWLPTPPRRGEPARPAAARRELTGHQRPVSC